MWSLLLAGLLSTALPRVAAIGGPQCLSFSSTPYALSTQSQPATFILDSSDWPGVHRAVLDLQNDLEKVTGQRPTILNLTLAGSWDATSIAASNSSNIPIIIGTLGRSSLMNLAIQLNTTIAQKAAAVTGKWEAGIGEVLQNPMPGISAAYVIAGSDKRGSIYGIYDLSEQAGVSPWYWWADVPVKKHAEIYVDSSVSCSRGEPSVKYRGIFLNDEQPALTNWAVEKYSNGTAASRPPFNRFFYSTIFELLLRLKANYLWPAIWNSAFGIDDPLNQFTADYFGIVMGTSHQEPMLRSSPPEWNMFGSGPWNWDQNSANLTKFWTDGVQRGKPFESIYTIGMRGTGDLPLSEEANVDLLERIVTAQRGILSNVYGREASTVPQVWCLYKEVQGYYERGMRVPDDVILLWTDDNWGNIRRLPESQERGRSGGAGVYYHFDYVGDPRDYKWGNAHALSKFHHQLELAKKYDADKLWIVNVGDLKPHEISIDFFMTYAFNTSRWTKDDIDEYRYLWALREFGSEELAPKIADVLERYSRLNFRVKSELINSTTYSLISYREAEGVLAEWDSIYQLSDSISKSLDQDYAAAYFELIHHPVVANRNTQAMYINAGLNQLAASQARSRTNALADAVQDLFEKDEDIRDQYHALLNGKWDQMMSQTHLGYYYWQQPMLDSMPSVTRVQKRQQALAGAMRINVENSRGAWPGDNSNQCAQGYNCPPPGLGVLTPYSAIPNRYFEVSAGGPTAFDWTATSDAKWLKLDPANGHIADASSFTRVIASVDWAQIPVGNSAPATITVSSTSGQSLTITLTATNAVLPAGFVGFVESDGTVSIEAEHFIRSTVVDGVGWEVLPGYGKVLSAISPAVVPDKRWTGSSGPSVEYDYYAYSGGNHTVTVYTAPSMNTNPGNPLTYAVSVDGAAPVTIQPMPIDATPGNLPAIWKQYVAEEVVRQSATFAGLSPGKHTVKIFATEIGIVVEKIVVETLPGSVQYSYLGPPESYRAK